MVSRRTLISQASLGFATLIGGTGVTSLSAAARNGHGHNGRRHGHNGRRGSGNGSGNDKELVRRRDRRRDKKARRRDRRRK
jgi:hypothetical protein